MEGGSGAGETQAGVKIGEHKKSAGDGIMVSGPRVQLHTTFNVSPIATEAGYAGELRDCGTDSGRPDVRRLAAHRTGEG